MEWHIYIYILKKQQKQEGANILTVFFNLTHRKNIDCASSENNVSKFILFIFARHLDYHLHTVEEPQQNVKLQQSFYLDDFLYIEKKNKMRKRIYVPAEEKFHSVFKVSP